MAYLLPLSLLLAEEVFVWELWWEYNVTLWGFGDIWAAVIEVKSTGGKWQTRLLVRWLPVCWGLGPVDVAGVGAYDHIVTVSTRTGIFFWCQRWLLWFKMKIDFQLWHFICFNYLFAVWQVMFMPVSAVLSKRVYALRLSMNYS